MASDLEARKNSVPDLVRTPALDIGAEDVELRRLYIGQFMSQAVQEGLVKAGDVYLAAGADDPSPEVLAPTPIHVLTMRRGKSASVDGDLQLFDFDDPEAPEDSWVTYNYIVVLPEIDQEVPVKWLLTRTGKPSAQRINTVLKRNESAGPPWLNAFEVTTVERKNDKGRFFVPSLTIVEAKPNNVAIANELFSQMNPSDAPSV